MLHRFPKQWLIYVFGFVHLWLIVQQLLIAGSYMASTSNKTASLIHLGVMTVVFWIAVFHFLGVFWQKSVLLWPYLIVQAISILCLFLVFAVSIFAFYAGTSIRLRITFVHARVPISPVETSMLSAFTSVDVSPFLSGSLVALAVLSFIATIFNMLYFKLLLDFCLTSRNLKTKAEPMMEMPVLTSAKQTMQIPYIDEA